VRAARPVGYDALINIVVAGSGGEWSGCADGSNFLSRPAIVSSNLYCAPAPNVPYATHSNLEIPLAFSKTVLELQQTGLQVDVVSLTAMRTPTAATRRSSLWTCGCRGVGVEDEERVIAAAAD
jgi:hypothetical protein